MIAYRYKQAIIDKVTKFSAWSHTQLRSPLYHFTVYGYAFLYMYTGYDKLRNVEVFIKGNSKIPLIGQYAELVGWGIPLLEILLAVTLVFAFGKTQKMALSISVIMMGIFTMYLSLMLLFAPDRLCNCGGVIESMSWITHLFFNIFCLGIGIYVIKKNTIIIND